MKIYTILDNIDSGHMALPEFQRGYVWNRDQVRGLFDSLYRRHPVGSLLVWVTESKGAEYRGSGKLAPGVVNLLLDGQQRMTSLYGVIRGQPPKFFDGSTWTFTGLHFHLGDESFAFYQRSRMANDPLWIDVSKLMREGDGGIGSILPRLLSADPTNGGQYVHRLATLLSIRDIDLHVDQVTGEDKSLEIVVDIFNRVNSKGTKLSKGDLALAKICVNWPQAREAMKTQLKVWEGHGFDFSLDWLLRSVNTVLTGEAQFIHLHDRNAEELQDGLKRATKAINTALNMIGGRFGLDHDRVLFGKFAIPVMARYLDQRKALPDERERDKLLFWYIQAGMWGRFSSATETSIDQDLAAIEDVSGGLDRLIDQLRLWHGDLRVEPGHFFASSLGARFYPILYTLTRMGEAEDWGTGLPLKADTLGKMNSLEVHHIFPRVRLYERNYDRSQVNALANFCFLTKETNLDIRDRLPEDYFHEVEKRHPGALASQWIPTDQNLWRVENYDKFLEARRERLAEEMNQRLANLLHGDPRWLQGPPSIAANAPSIVPTGVVDGIANEEEEQVCEGLNTWVVEQGLTRGLVGHEIVDDKTGDQRAVLDLAWPKGIQRELTQPVAVLLNEGADVIAFANRAGYRCFTNPADFRRY